MKKIQDYLINAYFNIQNLREIGLSPYSIILKSVGLYLCRVRVQRTQIYQDKAIALFKGGKIQKSLFLSIFMFSIFTNTYSQVQSTAFKAVIESMLSKSVPTVSCDDLKKMNNTILLDTRAKREFEVSHIQNAKWIGYDEFNLDRMKDIPKDSPIVVYCSIGVRSEKIGEKLQKAGYKNVKNLYGSIFEWVNQGNLVYDTNEKPTKKIHGYSRTWGVWVKKGEKVYD
jgi:rhodanese-related sulfurtransferase